MALVSAKIHPSEVRGKLRTWRTRVALAFSAIFLVLPWLRIGGRSVFLFDIPGRKFSLLGHLFGATDVPLILFFVGGFILAIVLLTAIFGRVWCGWACPQTVFIDLVFRRIETWIEGDAVTRRRRDLGPLDFDGVFRKSTKWALFVAAGAVISHSVLAYFVGTERLFAMMRGNPSENPETFVVMVGVLAITVFNFGFFRERFCTHVCPYGRLQTVLLDDRSAVVAYDSKRPDCIDCRKCVTVCPTGIDIRKGLQLECIACTACIDACDPVMKKIGKPLGLIRYATPGSAGEAFSPRRSAIRARPIAYALALIGVFSGFVFVVAGRAAVDVAVLRAIGAPYESIVREGEPELVQNHFYLDLHNQTFEPRRIEFSAVGSGGAVTFVSAESPVLLEAGERRRISGFLRFPKSILVAGSGRIGLRSAVDGVRPEVTEREVGIVGPY